MPEYFAVTNSNAAPFFSDMGTSFIEANSPEEARRKVKQEYKHPAGLYALNVYQNANDYHKGVKPLIQWLSKRADIRENGLTCSECGGKTSLFLVNINGSNIDIHTCNKCGTKVKVDMK